MCAKSVVKEGSAVLSDVGGDGVPSRKHDVFFNSEMKHQRDVFVAVVDSFKKFPTDRELFVGLPLEASGIRAIRLAKECAGQTLKIHVNDMDEAAIKSLRQNLSENSVSVESISQLNADSFFAQAKGFDIVDLDPFGGPGPFIDGAVKRLSRGGLLCVTATDTAPLCGLYADVCVRKYWSIASHDMSMHEWAVRILVRYCQLIGAQYDKALLPVLCYKKDHYVRLYLQCKKSKELASQIVREHHYVYIHQNSGEVSLVAKKNYFKAGPMYLGALVDSSTFDEKKFRSHITDGWVDRLFSAGKNSVGYYTVPQLCSLHKVSKQPSVESVLKCLRSKKYFAYESLNFVESIKSNCSYKQFVSALKEISKASVKLRKK